ncbi:Uncharacterised protein [Vibrio cholerae]|nr:Uncharacterised protein [Vibrio cholerae]CRZ65492.1 Uncharacterised protein [Vibrio cholerae]CRZ69083.1 Uncharacterised protein [Vibrio cholerae]CRZ90251.1 Uncharacterised protein [Vibrio cholerae]CSA48361.1 Uncharacterised protein [Vibrio cholerae]
MQCCDHVQQIGIGMEKVRFGLKPNPRTHFANTKPIVDRGGKNQWVHAAFLVVKRRLQ